MKTKLAIFLGVLCIGTGAMASLRINPHELAVRVTIPPIAPETTDSGARNPVASCDFVQKNLDATHLDIQANGTIIATANEAYDNPSPFYAYHGLAVKSDLFGVNVQGVLSTLSGSIALNVTIPRAEAPKKAVTLLGSPAICKVNY